MDIITKSLITSLIEDFMEGNVQQSKQNQPASKIDGIIKLIKSANWKERLLGEYYYIKDKLEKLHKTNTKIVAGTVKFKAKTPTDLLVKQESIMTAYLNLLETRLELEGIKYQKPKQQVIKIPAAYFFLSS